MTVTANGACRDWQGNKETEYQTLRSGIKIAAKFTKCVDSVPECDSFP
jgi:hypothetical protein